MLTALILAAAAVAVIVALLSLTVVKKWFRSKTQISNKAEVNIILKQRLETGEYKTIAGVFDTATEDIVEVNAWVSQSIDHELESLDRASIIRDLD